MSGSGRIAGAVIAVVLMGVASFPAAAAFQDEGGPGPLPPPAIVSHPVESVRVPVLMYHHVSELPRDADRLRRELTVSPAAFRAQLDWLREEGYTTVTADDVWSALERGTPLPPQPVVLTFDDGYADAYDVIFPALREHGAVGVFFVVAGLLGHDGYLTAEQAREMAGGGMDIESHGVDHVNFAKLTPVQLRSQLCGSRAALSAVTGHEVWHVAYPNGDAPASATAPAECGYRSGFLKSGGSLQRRSALFALTRTRVPGGANGSVLPYLLSR